MTQIFLLILLLFLIIACWVWWQLLYLIPMRQVWLILNRASDRVSHIAIGPTAICLWPWQKVVPIHLTPRGFTLKCDEIATADLAATTQLNVYYAFDPALLQAADLDKLLSSLEKIDNIVQTIANYILRSLISNWTTAELLTPPTCRSRLENQLQQTLQAQVQPFGLRIHTVRLIIQPTPAMLRAQLAASQIQVEAEARAQALAKLIHKIGPDHDLRQLLSLELLQMAQQGDSHLLTTLNLPFLGSANQS